MVDIHSHILPGIDDGARDIEMALAMARMAVENGVTHMFATPHHVHFTRLTRSEVAGRVAILQSHLDSAGIPLTVVPGHEVFLYEGTLADLEMTLAGPLGDSRYILAEPSFYTFDANTVMILLELLNWGFVPILAHPERIIPIQKNPTLIEPILEHGGLTQITAGSLEHVHLLGGVRGLLSGSAAARTAREMLDRGWVDIIASDAHNTTARRPGLTVARDAVAELVGREQANTMVTTTPQAIMADQLLLE